jgi:hypothetical protein
MTAAARSHETEVGRGVRRYSHAPLGISKLTLIENVV